MSRAPRDTAREPSFAGLLFDSLGFGLLFSATRSAATQVAAPAASCPRLARTVFASLLVAGALCLPAEGRLSAAAAMQETSANPLSRDQRLAQDGLVEFSHGLLTIVAPVALRSEAATLAKRGAELLPRLEQDLRQSLTAPMTMVLLPKDVPPILQNLDQQGPAWATGFMLPLQRIGAIRMHRVTSYPFNSSEMVLVHEMSHLVLHDKVGRKVPRWFDEAVATREGRRRGARDFLFFTTSSLLTSVPSLASLDRGFNGSEDQAGRAYLVSFEFITWAVRRHGPELIPDLLEATVRRSTERPIPLDARTDFEAAWQETTGFPLTISEQQWRQSAFRFTRWLPFLLTSNWLWVSMAVLAFVAFLSRRRQTLAQYQRWEEQEALDAKPLGPRPSALPPPASSSNGIGENIDEDKEPPIN